MTENHVRVNQGSKSDWKWTNKLLALFQKLGIRYGVSTGSCHWGAGKEFEEHIKRFPENIIVIIGGMSLAAPGIASALDRNAKKIGRIMMGIPLDEAAHSAIEDLPPGTPVLTCGYNRVNVEASIINAGLAIANIIARYDLDVRAKLQHWFEEMGRKKQSVTDENLIDGLLPDPKK